MQVGYDPLEKLAVAQHATKLFLTFKMSFLMIKQ